VDRYAEDDGEDAWQAAGQVISMVSGKWTVPVLSELKDGPRNYNELARAVGTDNKTLARTLRPLLAEKLVLRESHDSQHVTYRLAPRAREMTDLVEALACWWQSA
jgi:DNA-binding HxlR family transcriptional regulator